VRQKKKEKKKRKKKSLREIRLVRLFVLCKLSVPEVFKSELPKVGKVLLQRLAFKHGAETLHHAGRGCGPRGLVLSLYNRDLFPLGERGLMDFPKSNTMRSVCSYLPLLLSFEHNVWKLPVRVRERSGYRHVDSGGLYSLPFAVQGYWRPMGGQLALGVCGWTWSKRRYILIGIRCLGFCTIRRVQTPVRRYPGWGGA